MSGSVAQQELVPAATGLAIRGPQDVIVTPEQLSLAKETVAKDATDAEFSLFVYDCRRRGVHPLDRLIHFTKRGGKYTPVTSIDMFRSRAASTREHMGTDDAIFTGTPGDPDFAATVTAYRMVQGEKCPFTATARMSEYMPEPPNDFMWKKMPHGQLGKCAEALALRKAFPQELDGLYSIEEMDQAGAQDQTKPRVQPPQRRSGAKSVGSSSTQGKGDGQAQTTGPVNIGEVKQPTGKKFYRIEVLGDTRYFTAWPGEKDDAIGAAKKFSGEEAKAIVSFIEKKAGDKSYFNVVAVAAAPDAPSAAVREPGADDGDIPTEDEIFGGKK